MSHKQFHSYEMSGIGKCMETKYRVTVGRNWGEREREMEINKL